MKNLKEAAVMTLLLSAHWLFTCLSGYGPRRY